MQATYDLKQGGETPLPVRAIGDVKDRDVVCPVTQSDTDHDVHREECAQDTPDRLWRHFGEVECSDDRTTARTIALHRPGADHLIDAATRGDLQSCSDIASRQLKDLLKGTRTK